MKHLILITLLVTLAGCLEYENAPREKAFGATHIKVWHDDERGVTCWLYGASDGGISCLPDGVLR